MVLAYLCEFPNALSEIDYIKVFGPMHKNNGELASFVQINDILIREHALFVRHVIMYIYSV